MKQQISEFYSTLKLFQTNDFYLQDETELKRTELTHVVQFIECLLQVKRDVWERYAQLQKLVQVELSQSVAFLQFDKVVEDL